jgi:glycosyltransferase involved in cell wall biosynthesis
MRLLLVGAFPYPHHHGSQVYFQEHAIALRDAGCAVDLLTHAAGREDPVENDRALAGFEHRTTPPWSTPRARRSGPSWGKPMGDLGLAMTLRDAIASNFSANAYDAILTHNVEATLVALLSLSRPRPPILYCAHGVWQRELSAYLKSPKKLSFTDSSDQLAESSPWTRSLNQLGAAVDHWIARRVNGWIVLTQFAERVMRQSSDAPGELVVPCMPDPRLALPDSEANDVARQHGLEPGRFFLYSGNLDAYQEFETLAASVAELARDEDVPPRIVIASHRPGKGPVADWARSCPGVDFCPVETVREMQALLAAARASLIMRRAEGGFPIKLVNSLAVGTPVLSFHGDEWGLAHGQNSLICKNLGSTQQRAGAMASAIRRLDRDDALALQLSAGARRLYLARHLPEGLASRTISLVKKMTAPTED